MSFFDFIKVLRTAEPDVGKAKKAALIFSGVCVFVALWNFTLLRFIPREKFPFQNIPEYYSYIILTVFMSLGALFLVSSKGIKEQLPWGKRLAQTSIFLLAVAVVLVLLIMFRDTGFGDVLLRRGVSSVFFGVFFVLFFLQFIVPAYFGIRYFGKLPVSDGSTGSVYREFEKMTKEHKGNVMEPKIIDTETAYHESLFPFGLHLTFIIFMFGAVGLLFILHYLVGRSFVPFGFMIVFSGIFIGPVLYNNKVSSFQINREVVLSRVGGGSIYFFNGTWPFFKVLLYRDGIEIRVMFQRYFVPYDKMNDVPKKAGFFTRGVLIESNLPGVPSAVRIFVFGMAGFIAELNRLRDEYVGSDRLVGEVKRR